MPKHWPTMLGIAIAFVACSNRAPESAASPAADSADSAWLECSEPRPQMCTREYLPVCAERDNGVRCVTTPCDSTELHSYATGCTACSDPAVYRYRQGACATDQ